MTERHTPPCSHFTDAMATEARSHSEFDELEQRRKELLAQGVSIDSPEMEEINAGFREFSREHFDTTLLWHAARNCVIDSNVFSTAIKPDEYCPVLTLKKRLEAKATKRASQG